MMHMRKLALGLAAATSVVLPAIGASTAQAASYNSACGSGYGVIDSMPIGSTGTVFLTYNSSTGKNCVVTVRNTSGTAVHMVADISLAGQPWIEDSGNYTTYAGPVYVYAPHSCIDWGGQIGSAAAYQYDVHCS